VFFYVRSELFETRLQFRSRGIISDYSARHDLQFQAELNHGCTLLSFFRVLPFENLSQLLKFVRSVIDFGTPPNNRCPGRGYPLAPSPPPLDPAPIARKTIRGRRGHTVFSTFRNTTRRVSRVQSLFPTRRKRPPLPHRPSSRRNYDDDDDDRTNALFPYADNDFWVTRARTRTYNT